MPKRQGKFKESLEFYTKGHKLGSNRANWRYPSSNWVRNGQRLVELDEALAAHRSGTQPAENATSKVELASFAFQDKKDYPTALQLYEAAFKQQPALVATHRYVAACSAIATAEKTADDLSDEEGLALRQKALAWLEADLQDWKTKLQSNPQQATAIRQVLARWLRDETLSGVRDSTKLS